MLRAIGLLALAITFEASAYDFSGWWNGDGGTGDWLGARETLADRGWTFEGSWAGAYLGVVDGGEGVGGAFEEQLFLSATFDAGVAWGLRGLSLSAGVRWRDGQDVNKYAGASPVFDPAHFQSGKGWRLMPVSLTWRSGEWWGIPDFLMLTGGWQNPYNYFLQQPQSRLFWNNMIISSKGITANGVGWSSSYIQWGGTLRVRPRRWAYAQVGLYTATPGATATSNHGLAFAGAHPASANGLYALGELGVTPEIGPSKLPGKYAFGGYSWGLEADSYLGYTHDYRWGLYWQADQMLWREPSAAPVDPKSAPSLSDQGLSAFSYFYFAPEQENALPFYFHAGLTYRGLLPTRDNDQCGVVVGTAFYSHGFITSDEMSGRELVKDYEGVIEFDYRFQVNRWSYIQPFIQYLFRPGGLDQTANATVLGVGMGALF